MKPVLFATGHAPPERVGAFAALHEREGVEFALFGGRALHATEGEATLPFPHRHVGPGARSAPWPRAATIAP